MTQNWIILDLDDRVCLHGGGKLGEWFWTVPSSVLDALRIPNTRDKIDTLLAGPVASQHAPLFRLPPELIDAIYTHIVAGAGTYDTRLFQLALTCKASLACAQRHIIGLHMRHHAPLVGHRLICIGDGARTLKDYPHSLFTSAEAGKLLGTPPPSLVRSRVAGGPAAVPNSGGTGTSAAAAEEEAQASLYTHATAHWPRYSWRRPCLLGSAGLGNAKPGLMLLDLLYRPSAIARMSPRDFTRFQALTAPRYDDNAAGSADAAPPWVLCNLSKHEYVRADGGALVRAGNGQGEGVDAESGSTVLWHMLLACICWSPSGVTDMAFEGEELWRGRWAGDRFVVTKLDKLGQPEVDAPWKDVTTAVAGLVRHLRASDGSFGDTGVVH